MSQSITNAISHGILPNGRIATVGQIARWHKEQWGLNMSNNNLFDQLPPLMGLQEEQYIPSHRVSGAEGTSWSNFYTGIANGKRVYVWSYYASDGDTMATCVMVSDFSDPGYGASVAEIQHMFADQHSRNKKVNRLRTHRFGPRDPFLLQAFLYEVTRGGNERMEITT